jgi:small subunit ribosomal protein S6
MFLIDSSLAGSDWDGTISSIKTILEKVEAEVVSINKWDDRKLAYDIKGKNRGTYILSYFRVDGDKIKDIEHSVRLSEKIMRVLILNAERLSQDDIDKETPAMKQEKESRPEKPEAKSEQGDIGSGETKGAPQPVTEPTKPLPISDISSSGVSTLVEEAVENQPEQSKVEGPGPTD